MYVASVSLILSAIFFQFQTISCKPFALENELGTYYEESKNSGNSLRPIDIISQLLKEDEFETDFQPGSIEYNIIDRIKREAAEEEGSGNDPIEETKVNNTDATDNNKKDLSEADLPIVSAPEDRIEESPSISQNVTNVENLENKTEVLKNDEAVSENKTLENSVPSANITTIEENVNNSTTEEPNIDITLPNVEVSKEDRGFAFKAFKNLKEGTNEKSKDNEESLNVEEPTEFSVPVNQEKKADLNVAPESQKNEEIDNGELPAGESKQKAGKDNTILLFLFLGVAAVGTLAFAYNFLRKKKLQVQENAILGPDDEKPSAKNLEMKPLMNKNPANEVNEKVENGQKLTPNDRIPDARKAVFKDDDIVIEEENSQSTDGGKQENGSVHNHEKTEVK